MKKFNYQICYKVGKIEIMEHVFIISSDKDSAEKELKTKNSNKKELLVIPEKYER